MRQSSHRRRDAVARRHEGTGLEYGLIAAALAIAIVTVVAGLGARYGTPGMGGSTIGASVTAPTTTR